MDRAFSSGASVTPPSAPVSPSTGYATAGNPGTATPATKPGPWWYHMVTEEQRAVIVAAGITPDYSVTTQLRDAILALIAGSVVNLAAGAVSTFAQSTAPTGWLKANGAAISRTTYATLFAAIGTTFGVGDGSTTFNVPDLRGQFIRGWVDNGSIDSGRSFGSSQTDAMQGHQHTLGSTQNQGASGGAVIIGGSNNNTGNPVTDGTNGTPRTAAETRPTNVALLACIKY